MMGEMMGIRQLPFAYSAEDEGSGGVTSALTSLWSASSDKDDTCRTWGLVSLEKTAILSCLALHLSCRARRRGSWDFLHVLH